MVDGGAILQIGDGPDSARAIMIHGFTSGDYEEICCNEFQLESLC